MLGLRCLLSFSLVAVSKVYVLVATLGLLTGGFSCCGAQALGTKAQKLQHVGSAAGNTGSVAMQNEGSSWSMDQTCVPCSGRRILSTRHKGSPAMF